MNFEEIYKECKPHTMTCKNRMHALYKSVHYVSHRNVPGDLVETGVWKGGNVLLMALTLESLGVDRKIWAYDTFEGMPEPSEHDRRHDGKKPDFSNRNNLKVSLGEAKSLLEGYDIKFVKGKVEETIPSIAPKKIAVLRTDTDFYESTRHTLKHLYHRISKGGVFVNDDYYHFKGAKKAVDEYVSGFSRIGDTNAIIKTL